MTGAVKVKVAIAASALAVIRAAAKDEGEGEENTYGLPDGEPIADALTAWFHRLQEKLLGTVPAIGAPLPESFPTLADYADPMASALTPLLSVYWDKGGKAALARLGLDPRTWEVTNPFVAHAVRSAALALSRSTLETSRLRADAALARTRETLLDGLTTGKARREIARDLGDVFSPARAKRIAVTEASRAVHDGQLAADEASEVVAGLEWLVSANSCPLCQKVATEAKRVRLGQDFAVVGDHPHYSRITHPPLHPGCRCTVIEVLKPEYGGPADPGWSPTLHQPREGLKGEYRPPAGAKVPAPEPERIPHAPEKSPREVALDHAVALIEAEGCKVRREGHDKIVAIYGPAKASDIAAAMMWNARGKGILLNPESPYWSDPAGHVRKLHERGYASSTAAEHPIWHEIGHARHYDAVGFEQYQKIRERRWSEAERKLVRTRVSYYASENPAEFVAEVYAARRAGVVYNDDVLALYQELGGPE